MTIRRWLRSNPKRRLTESYERLVIQGLETMLSRGELPVNSAWAQKLVSRHRTQSITAALAGMGVDASSLANLKDNRKNMLGFLNVLGDNKKHRSDVDRGHKKISSLTRLGLDWKAPLATLLGVVRSKKLLPAQKLIAYGALFYLLCPLDLIPDSVPVFGYADDFVFVSLAATHYFNMNKKEDE